MAYDPVKAHEYYIRTRKLKGRKKGTQSSLIGDGGRPVTSGGRNSGGRRPPPPVSNSEKQAKRVKRLQGKVDALQGALSKAQAALVKRRAEERKTERENSDGKSTTEEKRASKEYRDKNRAEIANKRKSASGSSGGSSSGSSSSSSSSKSVNDMSVEDLETRIIKIRSALSEAKRQLANASNSLGHMAHSAILSDPEVNVHFARYRSAERKPST